MKTISDLLYILNKIDLAVNLESNDNEKLNCIRRILIDDFEDFTSVKFRNILIIVDGFIYFFVKIKSRLSGYW